MAPLQQGGIGWTNDAVIRALNDSHVPAKFVFSYVFGFNSEDEIIAARDDTWHHMMERMKNFKVPKGRYPGQTSAGQDWVVDVEGILNNDGNMSKKHFNRSLFQRGIKLGWDVPGALPGDTRPRSRTIKRSFIGFWLHYVWDQKKKDIKQEDKDSDYGMESGRALTPVGDPGSPLKRRRHDSTGSANSVTRKLDNVTMGGWNGGVNEVDTLAASRELQKSIPDVLLDATVWAAVINVNDNDTTTLTVKRMAASKLLSAGSTPDHPVFSLDKLKKKLTSTSPKVYGVDGTKPGHLNLCDDDDEEDDHIKAEWIRLKAGNSASDGINFLLARSKVEVVGVPERFRILSGLKLDDKDFTFSIAQPDPSFPTKKIKVTFDPDKDERNDVEGQHVSEAVKESALNAAFKERGRKATPAPHTTPDPRDAQAALNSARLERLERERLAEIEQTQEDERLADEALLLENERTAEAARQLRSKVLAETTAKLAEQQNSAKQQEAADENTREQEQPGQGKHNDSIPNAESALTENGTKPQVIDVDLLAEAQAKAEAADAAEDARLKERSKLYPHMTYGKHAPKPNIDTEGLAKPSIPMDDDADWIKVEWLSTNLDLFTMKDMVEDERDADEPVLNADEQEGKNADDVNVKVRTEQLTVELWKLSEQFVGWDPEEEDPNALVYLRGLTRAFKLKPYQVAALVFALRQVARREDWTLLGLDPGLGKTTLMFALIVQIGCIGRSYWDQGFFQRRNFHPAERDASFVEPHAANHPFNLSVLIDGEKPNIFVGPQLIVTRTNLIDNLLQDAVRSFDAKLPVPERMFFCICDAKNKKRNGYLLEGRYLPPNYFFVDDLVDEGSDAFPSEVDLRAHYTEDEVDEFLENGMTVAEILKTKVPEVNYRWQANWIVVTTNSTIMKHLYAEDNSTGRSVGLEGRDNTRTLMRTNFSYIHVDECHEAKGVDKTPWSVVNALSGMPGIFGYSGTPFTRLIDLFAPMMAAHGRYFVLEDLKTLARRPYAKLNVTGKDFGNGAMKWKSPLALTHADKQWVKDRCYRGMHDDVDTIRLEVEKAGFSKATQAGLGAMSRVRDRLKYSFLRFTEEMEWPPGKGTTRAIAMPPNTTWDVDLTNKLESAEKDAWVRFHVDAEKHYQGTFRGTSGFFTFATRVGLVTAFPLLALLMSKDRELTKQLGNFGVPVCEAIERNECPAIANAIPALMQSTTVRETFRICRENAKQKNSHQQPRKTVIVAFRPLAAKLIGMCFAHAYDLLIKNPKGTYPDYEFLRQDAAFLKQSPDNVKIRPWVLYGSWGSTAKKNIAKVQLARFTRNTDATYDNSKRIVIAVASAVKTGINLPPANSMVLLDSTWVPKDVVQTSSRIRRACITQQNRFTEVFRLIHQTKEAWWLTALGTKHTSLQTIMKAATASEVKEVIEID